ncbi:MAG: hypothetical protein QOK19_114 [Solirubrobacteraceae bacterium]|jgi:hypothetical protein|nr:hypothetical protein [Solirubrobacteraceae bacterium]
MAPGQDWCLQCGAGAPGSVGRGGWRPLAGVLAATTVLVLGAAAAGYAALSKKTRHAPVVTRTVAQATPAPTTPTPGVTPPTTSTPTPGIAKPPKIPLTAATPTPAATTPAVTPTTPSTTTGTGNQGNSGTGGSQPAEEPKPEAILLDTNAASTYNPYNYPTTWFGDPSLTIDGDTTTGWSAQVNPATAPNLAEGLLLDLKSARKLSAVKLVTSTTGITVQVYGTAARTVPASITDPAWVPLSRSISVKKRHAQIALRNRKKSYRFVTVWISKAPASALGTAEAPGKIVLDEIELLPVG